MVKTVELDGPLRGRILCMEVDGVITGLETRVLTAGVVLRCGVDVAALSPIEDFP